MSSPLRITRPPVRVYPGRPMITLDRVDFPEPLGPIRAWIWPCSTVRSMPRRISRSPTAACTSWISKVAGAVAPFVWLICSHLDQDIIVRHGHGEHVNGLDRRQDDGLSGLQVEGRPVLRAL